MTKDEALKLAIEVMEGADNIDVDMQAAIFKCKEALTQPVQEPEYEYLIDDLSEWKQYVEVDNAPYGLREHVTKVLLAHGMKEKNNG